jgi:hypothetical protein
MQFSLTAPSIFDECNNENAKIDKYKDLFGSNYWICP